MLNRRKLITSLTAFGCAPAIVRASSLMPVKSYLSVDEILNNALHMIGQSNRFIDGCPLSGIAILTRYEYTGLVIKTISEKEFYDLS